jgi:heat-inducible transcriptional repressor
MSLTPRREAILNTIVGEFIALGAPVASRAISSTDIGVSPATIRNDVTVLEEEGYVIRPHTSAGAVPTDKAYRFFVECLSRDTKLPVGDQLLIAELCHEANEELDKRLRLMATLLAHFVHNAALVTQPKAARARLKHVHLVSLQERLALLIVVLVEPCVVRQRTTVLPELTTQDELNTISNRFTDRLTGLSADGIQGTIAELAEDADLARQIVGVMRAEDKPELGRTYLEGLHFMLSQPELAKSPRTLTLLRLVERDDWVESALGPELDEEGVRVIIGQENREEALRDLSIVVGSYGNAGRSKGVIGVVGPKRMDYLRAIASVNYLASLLNESLCEPA